MPDNGQRTANRFNRLLKKSPQTLNFARTNRSQLASNTREA